MQNAPPYGAKRRLRVHLSSNFKGEVKDPQPLPYLYYTVIIPAYSAPPSHEYIHRAGGLGNGWVKLCTIYSLLYLSLCYWVYDDRRMGEGY
jgi:hypothetical protein